MADTVKDGQNSSMSDGQLDRLEQIAEMFKEHYMSSLVLGEASFDPKSQKIILPAVTSDLELKEIPLKEQLSSLKILILEDLGPKGIIKSYDPQAAEAILNLPVGNGAQIGENLKVLKGKNNYFIELTPVQSVKEIAKILNIALPEDNVPARKKKEDQGKNINTEENKIWLKDYKEVFQGRLAQSFEGIINIGEINLSDDKIAINFSKFRTRLDVLKTLKAFSALEVINIPENELNGFYKSIENLGINFASGGTNAALINSVKSAGNIEAEYKNSTYSLEISDINYKAIATTLTGVTKEDIMQAATGIKKKSDDIKVSAQDSEEWMKSYLATRFSNEFTFARLSWITEKGGSSSRKPYTLEISVNMQQFDDYVNFVQGKYKPTSNINNFKNELLKDYQEALHEFVDKLLVRIDRFPNIKDVAEGNKLIKAVFGCDPADFKAEVTKHDHRFLEETDLGRKFFASGSSFFADVSKRGDYALRKIIKKHAAKLGMNEVPPDEKESIPIWGGSTTVVKESIVKTTPAATGFVYVPKEEKIVKEDGPPPPPSEKIVKLDDPPKDPPNSTPSGARRGPKPGFKRKKALPEEEITDLGEGQETTAEIVSAQEIIEPVQEIIVPATTSTDTVTIEASEEIVQESIYTKDIKNILTVYFTDLIKEGTNSETSVENSKFSKVKVDVNISSSGHFEDKKDGTMIFHIFANIPDENIGEDRFSSADLNKHCQNIFSKFAEGRSLETNIVDHNKKIISEFKNSLHNIEEIVMEDKVFEKIFNIYFDLQKTKAIDTDTPVNKIQEIILQKLADERQEVLKKNIELAQPKEPTYTEDEIPNRKDSTSLDKANYFAGSIKETRSQIPDEFEIIGAPVKEAGSTIIPDDEAQQKDDVKPITPARKHSVKDPAIKRSLRDNLPVLLSGYKLFIKDGSDERGEFIELSVTALKNSPSIKVVGAKLLDNIEGYIKRTYKEEAVKDEAQSSFRLLTQDNKDEINIRIYDGKTKVKKPRASSKEYTGIESWKNNFNSEDYKEVRDNFLFPDLKARFKDYKAIEIIPNPKDPKGVSTEIKIGFSGAKTLSESDVESIEEGIKSYIDDVHKFYPKDIEPPMPVISIRPSFVLVSLYDNPTHLRDALEDRMEHIEFFGEEKDSDKEEDVVADKERKATFEVHISNKKVTQFLEKRDTTIILGQFFKDIMAGDYSQDSTKLLSNAKIQVDITNIKDSKKKSYKIQVIPEADAFDAEQITALKNNKQFLPAFGQIYENEVQITDGGIAKIKKIVTVEFDINDPDKLIGDKILGLNLNKKAEVVNKENFYRSAKKYLWDVERKKEPKKYDIKPYVDIPPVIENPLIISPNDKPVLSPEELLAREKIAKESAEAEKVTNLLRKFFASQLMEKYSEVSPTSASTIFSNINDKGIFTSSIFFRKEQDVSNEPAKELFSKLLGDKYDFSIAHNDSAGFNGYSVSIKGDPKEIFDRILNSGERKHLLEVVRSEYGDNAPEFLKEIIKDTHLLADKIDTYIKKKITAIMPDTDLKINSTLLKDNEGNVNVRYEISITSQKDRSLDDYYAVLKSVGTSSAQDKTKTSIDLEDGSQQTTVAFTHKLNVMEETILQNDKEGFEKIGNDDAITETIQKDTKVITKPDTKKAVIINWPAIGKPGGTTGAAKAGEIQFEGSPEEIRLKKGMEEYFTSLLKKDPRFANITPEINISFVEDKMSFEAMVKGSTSSLRGYLEKVFPKNSFTKSSITIAPNGGVVVKFEDSKDKVDKFLKNEQSKKNIQPVSKPVTQQLEKEVVKSVVVPPVDQANKITGQAGVPGSAASSQGVQKQEKEIPIIPGKEVKTTVPQTPKNSKEYTDQLIGFGLSFLKKYEEKEMLECLGRYVGNVLLHNTVNGAAVKDNIHETTKYKNGTLIVAISSDSPNGINFTDEKIIRENFKSNILPISKGNAQISVDQIHIGNANEKRKGLMVEIPVMNIPAFIFFDIFCFDKNEVEQRNITKCNVKNMENFRVANISVSLDRLGRVESNIQPLQENPEKFISDRDYNISTETLVRDTLENQIKKKHPQARLDVRTRLDDKGNAKLIIEVTGVKEIGKILDIYKKYLPEESSPKLKVNTKQAKIEISGQAKEIHDKIKDKIEKAKNSGSWLGNLFKRDMDVGMAGSYMGR